MKQTLTARQLAAQFDHAAADVDDAVAAVVQAAAYEIRGDAYDRVTRAADGSDNAAHRYAARQIEAEPAGKLAMIVGYHDRVADLAAAIEYGSALKSPGGHLASALNAEEPRFVRAAPAAAVKAIR